MPRRAAVGAAYRRRAWPSEGWDEVADGKVVAVPL